ncbi:MAG: hypothetical protein HEP71_10070 [Roseivirga sp.]|nr:hypothetical protein [Roseivirga sp.]
MRLSFLLLLLLFTSQNLIGQMSFGETLKMGGNSVGFKTIDFRDSSRLYGQQYRPILISIWYPAITGNDSPVEFRDHLFIAERKSKLTELTVSEEKATTDAFSKRISDRGASSEALNQLLSSTTGSFWNAAQTTGKYPLLLSIQGGGRPAYTQFILNQYLASHGYIVMAIADIRADPDRGKTNIESNINSLSADIDRVLGFVRSSGDFQITQTGIMGFSKAGEAIIHHQMNNQRFKAITMMDAHPEGAALEFLSGQSLALVTSPLLVFFSNHQGKLSYEAAIRDSLAFTFLPNNKTHKIRLMEANHGELTSAAILGDLVPGYNRWPAFGNARLSYETLCRLTLAFFNQHLKDLPDEQGLLREPLKTLALPLKFLVKH